jgi:hypothetical protein
MDEEDKKMSDIMINYPNGETLTFGEFWLQIVEDRDYGGRCAQIYMTMIKGDG